MTKFVSIQQQKLTLSFQQRKLFLPIIILCFRFLDSSTESILVIDGGDNN